ncbi:MAG: vitamin B12 dependent-methionine synthase activation domain-containing protein, partial [Perlabentimonas sp.]
GADKLASEYSQKGDDYNALMVKLLADRLAEAFAEVLHKKVRREIWGYTPNEQCSIEDVFKEKYQGIRPAPGYPACPDHRQKATIFSLLNAKENADIDLTKNMAMVPPASVSGYYFSHPQSKYFNVGKIDQEQLEDYSQRMGDIVSETKKFIPNNVK